MHRAEDEHKVSATIKKARRNQTIQIDKILAEKMVLYKDGKC